MFNFSNLGFKKSKLNGTEHIFGASLVSSLPKKYSYQRYLPKVINQGSEPICVPCSLSVYLNYRENLKTGSKKDNKIDYFEIYGSKTTQGNGMTFKEALRFLRHNGVDSKAGRLKIEEYSMIKSAVLLRTALITNGPCFGALPVYNDGNTFWKKENGDSLLGYHAIAIVGYDEEGFIIRNSWGTEYADKGYTKIAEKDFGNFIELWTISE